MKVTVINNYITPYRDELFSELQAMDGGYDLDIIYAAQPEAKRRAFGWGDAAPDRESRVRSANDPVLHMPSSNNRVVIPFRIARWLFLGRRDLLVCTLSRDMVLVQLVCFLAARLRSARLVYWIGDVDTDERPGFVYRLVDRLRIAVARRADAHIFYSAKSKEWLDARCGDRAQKAYWIGGQVRSRIQLGTEHRAAPANRKAVLRLLTVGGKDPRKGLQKLLADLRTLRSSLDKTVEVIVVGAERCFRERVADMRVISVGRLSHKEMPSIYGRADISIIASAREPWGFVFNESIQAGRPCIVSRHAGSATVARSYGLAYTPGDPASLASAIRRARDLSPENMKSISSLLSVQIAAQSFVRFVTSVGRGQICAIRDY